MNRFAWFLVGVFCVLASVLSEAWPAPQEKKPVKQKKERIVVDSPQPGQDIAFADLATKVASGSNNDTNVVYGLLFDPDSPDAPLAGTTDPNMAGNDGSKGPWVVQFDSTQVFKKVGYLLRVVDTVTGNSQDCVFNIVDNPSANPTNLVTPDPTLQEVTVTETTLQKGKRTSVTHTYLQIQATVKAANPKAVHGEAFIPATKKVIAGKTQRTKNSSGSTDVTIKIDITTIAQGTLMVVRVHSYCPHGQSKRKEWTKQHP